MTRRYPAGSGHAIPSNSYLQIGQHLKEFARSDLLILILQRNQSGGMVRMAIRAIVLVLCGLSAAAAAEPVDPDLPVSSVAIDPLKVDGLRELVPALIEVIREIGRGDAQNAAEALQHHWYRPYVESDNPFDEDERGDLIRNFQSSFEHSREFETVEVLGATKGSSKAYRVWCMANGDFGPALFEWLVYYYDGRWRVVSVSYTASEWDRLAGVADRLSQVPAIVYSLSPGSELPAQQFSSHSDANETSGFPVSEAEPLLRQMASVIEKIGEDDAEGALFTLHSARPARKQNSLEKHRSDLVTALGKIKSARYETVELIAARKISAGAFRIYLAANGTSGPHLYRCDVYRYRGRWYFHDRLNLGSGRKAFAEMEMLSSEVPLAKPLVINLESGAGVANRRLEPGTR